MKKSLIIIILLSVISIFYLKSCTSYKLDEATFYKDEHVELKVVRYQENIFLHYNGPVFRVACRSKNTKPQSWHKVQDSNWTEIYSSYPALSNLGWDPSLDSLTEAAKQGYHVTDINTLIYTTGGAGVAVSWDGCASFKNWSPRKIPDNLVKQDGYLQCLKVSKVKEESGALIKDWGKNNCKAENFYGDNTPKFSAIEASRNGYATFEVTSNAFKENKSYYVTTEDYGQTWRVRDMAAVDKEHEK